MIRRLLGLALGALVVALPAGAQNYRPEYKLSTVVGTAFPWGQAGERWGNLVRERTQGRINIKMYPGAQLVGGDQTREFTAVRQGAIDLAIGSTINWSPQVKELNLFSLPFLMPDYAALDSLTHGDVGREVFRVVDRQGVLPLAWGENGFRELSNSKKPIRSPQDLKGMKLRVVGSPLFNEIFSALGANPAQMSFADAQPALATGAVDGQENPLSVFVAAKMHTLKQQHLTLWGYTADPLIFAANKDVWESWTAADREIVRQAALQAGKECVAAARKGIAAPDNAVLKQIESLGVTITHLSETEKDAFRKATRPVYDKWKATVGVELVTKAEQSISARRK